MRTLQAIITTWVRNPLGRLVTCERGTLWLCFDGIPDAIMLEAGQSYRCTASSPLAIRGLRSAGLTVA